MRPATPPAASTPFRARAYPARSRRWRGSPSGCTWSCGNGWKRRRASTSTRFVSAPSTRRSTTRSSPGWRRHGRCSRPLTASRRSGRTPPSCRATSRGWPGTCWAACGCPATPRSTAASSPRRCAAPRNLLARPCGALASPLYRRAAVRSRAWSWTTGRLRAQPARATRSWSQPARGAATPSVGWACPFRSSRSRARYCGCGRRAAP